MPRDINDHFRDGKLPDDPAEGAVPMGLHVIDGSGDGRGSRRQERSAQEGPTRTELELADVFVKRFSGEVCFCQELGGWHFYDGARWKRDRVGHAKELAKKLARDLAAEAEGNKNRSKEARRAGSAAGIDAVLKIAASDPQVALEQDRFDADPWKLNVQNGTVDLKTGELLPHDPDDVISKVCRFDYDDGASAPLFDGFLREVQPEEEIRSYLQRAFGVALVGAVLDRVLFVLFGDGANGKSVLAEVTSKALGDYARPGPKSLLVRDGRNTPHPTDVASCAGSRLVVVHETDKGATFDASKVKLLTGGDELTARFMRGDFFCFEPTHTLCMLSNYKPRADATDKALWDRVQLVPFDVVIPKERQDMELASKIIEAEGAGILRWLVEGCRKWQQSGLQPPEKVTRQTAEYRASEDVIGRFIEERCTEMTDLKTQAAALYAAFKTWAMAQGEHPPRSNEFFAELQARGFQRIKTKSGKFYAGIGLNADADAEEGWPRD